MKKKKEGMRNIGGCEWRVVGRGSPKVVEYNDRDGNAAGREIIE